MKKFNCFKRLISLCLCMALMMCYIPLNAKADDVKLHTSVSESVADPGTADSWETMMGIKEDGNRYAGRVWVDKSVYRDGDVAVLNNSGEPGSTFQVELKEDEEFQIIFSALGSTMTTQKSITEMGPVDVVLILGTSVYMEEKDRDGVTRLERCITAVNGLLNDVLAIDNVRIGVVTYNIDSETVLPLAAYRNGVKLAVTDHGNHGLSNRGVVSAYDHDGKELGNDNGYAEGTNLQSGIDRGFGLLAEATEVEGRVPVAIVLNDGPADRASQEGYYEIEKHDDPDGTIVSGRNLYLSTLLNAAYAKTKIEENYGKEAIVYTVGVGIADNANAELLLHPADALNGFHYMNTNSEVKKAYEYFQRWSKGETVTYADWTFDHNYPNQSAAINDSKITGNIHYSDAFYDVSDTELVKAFEHICREMSSGAFNPISSSTSAEGGTGVDDTPLVYVDFIGQYMQVKEIQAVTLFGHSYGVINNPDGTYTVTEATGTNPTTNERWNTAEDIKISVTQIDGVQKMEVRINQEILPILMERVLSETVGSETVSTITELVQPPLRVYYTVGISSELLLPGGQVDASKLQGYPYIDDEAGTVSFYSNQFGVMNKGGGGDSHVGFQPAPENRFYYHQSNHGIFTKISNKSDGSTVTIPESNTYGILWDESKYDLTWMSYDDYQNAKDSDKVYTYVSYYRPTPTADDAENTAEEVTYLVCTDWEYMKESVAFYDANAESYLEGGQAIVQDQVADTVSAYKKANPDAQIYAVLGVSSLRTSRLHNMMVDKTANLTNTAAVRYAPEYTYETASIHNGNDVVVWLGNNGRLTVNIETGIALTNTVTETIGNADEICSLRVTVPEGVDAQPVVVDMEGASVASDYQDHVLTVHAKANQTVYVTGIPGGTICQIGGNAGEDYDITDITPEVRIPSVREVLSGADQFVPAVMISAPNKYGNLFITKEITSDHAIPEGILNTPFEMIVDVGTELAGEMLTVAHSERPSTLYSVTVDDNGHVRFRIKARQTFEILRLPAGTQVTVTEVVTDDHFAVSYRTRNHSGESADWDNILTIPSEGSATAVVMNRYTPSPVSVDLDIVGTKIFHSEGEHAGGSFVYQVQKWTGSVWEDIPGKTIRPTMRQMNRVQNILSLRMFCQGLLLLKWVAMLIKSLRW